MLVNVLPKSVKRKLHALFSSFLWGGLEEKRKIHLVNWETIIAPVLQEGLGILDLRDMGKTLIVKWVFNYTNNREALWRKVVCEKSKGNSRSLLPILGDMGNNSVLLGLALSIWHWVEARE